MSKNEIITEGSSVWDHGVQKKILKTDAGTELLETSIYRDKGILFVTEAGEWVTKEELEELLDVTILTEADFAKAGNLSPFTVSNRDRQSYFYFGGVEYHYTEDAELLRHKGLGLLAAAKEIERHHAEEVARAERVKAAEIEGKKRREIGDIATILAKDGSISNPIDVAAKLYEAGVRKV